MVYPIRADIIPILGNLTALLHPVAQANFVDLRFESEVEKYDLVFQPEILIHDLNQLLCRVITFTPQNYEVLLKAFLSKAHHGSLCIQVCNTGAFLGGLAEIQKDLQEPVAVVPAPEGGTIFERVVLSPASDGRSEKLDAPPIPLFFQKLQQSLHHYAINTAQLEAAAHARSEREGVFLQKVNALLLANLDREDFDVNALCKALALSRTRLYRTLTPLIKLPPSQYIKFLRLSKAKEYLETEDWTVAEVGFRLGFKDNSHFTRVFRKHFGFNPSHYQKKGSI